ncbi:MAG TPA: YceI family protein [Candidatus Paceibacterota bacterium]|nr:YceI family protein [Candidatus Paceibacterota bacterium]
MKRIIMALLAVALVAGAALHYATRPAAAPTKDIQSVADTIAVQATSSVYRISQSASQARFEVSELLYGKPKLVVGTTTQIAGDIAVEGGKIVIGAIKLNARTLVTDSEKRNGAINHLILKTDDAANEFISFAPRSSDLAGPVALGKPLALSVSGDLTIAGVTKPATFTATMTVTADRIMGTASTTVKRADYGLKIPSLSFVADVGESVSVVANIVADRVAPAR